MVEVECPSCTKLVDLGSGDSGEYECPYCNTNFHYEGMFPILIGNKPPTQNPLAMAFVLLLEILFYICTAGVGLIVAYLVKDVEKKKLKKWLQEYESGSLNPNLLSGFVLLIHSNLDGEILTDQDRPNHKFTEEDIESIHLYQQDSSGRHGTKKKERLCYVGIHIQGQEESRRKDGRSTSHALEIKAKSWNSGELIAEQISKVYGIKYRHIRDIVYIDSDGYPQILSSEEIIN